MEVSMVQSSEDPVEMHRNTEPQQSDTRDSVTQLHALQLEEKPSVEGVKKAGKVLKPNATTTPKSTGTGGASKRKIEAKTGGDSSSNEARPTLTKPTMSSASRTSGSVPATRRSSTGGLPEKQPIMITKRQSTDVGLAAGKRTSSLASDPLRKSLPEIRRTSASSIAKPAIRQSVPETRKSVPISPVAKTPRTPTSSDSSKQDSSKKTSLRSSQLSVSSVKKISSPSLDSTGSSGSIRKSITKVNSLSARSPTVSSGSKSGSVSTSLDRSSTLPGRKKVGTPESRDSRLIMLPQVEAKAGDDVVLDLSFNDFKGPGFEPLENCKALQQLYLAGNQIISLKSLPELPNLEHLRVEENPILKMSHLEAASILLVGPTLKKFNDRDLSREEIAIAKRYPSHTALCIRGGWELCRPEQAVGTGIPKVMKIDVRGELVEGNTIKGYVEVAWCGGTPAKGVAREFTLVLTGTNEYTLTKEDVGRRLTFVYTPVNFEGQEGKSMSVVSPTVKQALPPSLNFLSITGDYSEGGVLTASYGYIGGHEGKSIYNWYLHETSSNGTHSEISGATSSSYMLSVDDIGFFISVSCEPIRNDWARGPIVLSEQVGPIVPGDPLGVELVIPDCSEGQEVVPEKRYFGGQEGAGKYIWFRTKNKPHEPALMELANNCENVDIRGQTITYTPSVEDVGTYLALYWVPTRSDGKCGKPLVSICESPVIPGVPRMDKLEIEGRGFHTNLYAVRGVYSGGKEGKSRIQWLRSMVGSPDLISIPGETGRMYEANVDDVGYRLVAIYTPVRDDGVEGQPVSASTDPIAVEPDVHKEVKQKLDLGSVKFEALCDKDRSAKRVPGMGSLERRILEVNRKRVKVVKPGSKTSFPTTEIRGSYAPPFHVELFRNDQHRLRIVVDSENEVDLMVQTRHLRDVIVLVIRGLAQRFNSTSLNTLLKIEA
ncbi:UNVERIFIED_CONTAM: microtubule-associated protein AIR9 [Sesamum calycinum]|uniref:Microtubule-associated protein AIR9 n=1 Tax=Sesamum calycinum TaxID=2727403 RepID=A0AAW2Q7C6_9LAMI